MSKRLKADERRAQILQRAAIVFAEHGYFAAKTKDIANVCGVTEAVILSHFPTKLDLFINTCWNLYMKITADWRESAQKYSTGAEALKNIVKSNLQLMKNHPDIPRTIFHVFSASLAEKQIHDLFEKIRADELKFIQGLIERGIEDGSVNKNTDSKCLALIISGLNWEHVVNVAMKSEHLSDPRYPFNMFDCPFAQMGVLKPGESFVDF